MISIESDVTSIPGSISGFCMLIKIIFIRKCFWTLSKSFWVDLEILPLYTLTPKKSIRVTKVLKWYFLRTQILISPPFHNNSQTFRKPSFLVPNNNSSYLKFSIVSSFNIHYCTQCMYWVFLETRPLVLSHLYVIYTMHSKTLISFCAFLKYSLKKCT